MGYLWGSRVVAALQVAGACAVSCEPRDESMACFGEPRWLRSLLATLTLVMVVVVVATLALPPRAAANEADRWALWVAGGFMMVGDGESALETQLEAAHMGIDHLGPNISVGFEHFILDWLVLGALVEGRWYGGGGGYGLTGASGRPALQMGQVGVMGFVQPSMCLEPSRRCREVGLSWGARLGLGGGPSWLALREGVDYGMYLRGELALFWELNVAPVFFVLRTRTALVWHSGFGAVGLAFDAPLSVGAELGMGFRW